MFNPFITLSSQSTAFIANGLNGQAFPIGTRETPCDNIPDAVAIAVEKGFSTIQIIGNITLGLGDNLDGYTILGQNASRTLLNITPDAYVTNCEIRECYIMGILDGMATLRECVIGVMSYFSGYVHHCILTEAEITLGNDTTALFLHCYSGVAGTATPTINMGGSGQSLGIRNYNGGLTIKNRTGEDPISIDMNSGQFVADPTCTAGDINVRGVCKITDNSTGVCNIITDGKALIEQDDMPKQVWDYKL